jgi:PEP-CTERM motif
MIKNLVTSLTGICLFVMPTVLNAQFSYTAQVGGVPTVSGATLLNFDGTLPSILSLNNASQLTGSGATYAAPYFSGSTASYFGESPTTGADTTPFIAISGGGTATFTFSSPQNYFGLLIGSIDADNTLSFYNSANSLIGTISGTNILGPNGDYGDRGQNGTVYVNITSPTPFSSVVLATPISSFEFDDVAYADVVPEPGTCALAAVGLGTLGLVCRKKRA